MTRHYVRIAILLFGAFVVAAVAQDSKTLSAAKASPRKVTGFITSTVGHSGCGMSSFSVKPETVDEIEVHFEVLKDSSGKIFAPRMGETITVTGVDCCESNGHAALYATEIVLAKTTYRSEPGPATPEITAK